MRLSKYPFSIRGEDYNSLVFQPEELAGKYFVTVRPGTSDSCRFFREQVEGQARYFFLSYNHKLDYAHLLVFRYSDRTERFECICDVYCQGEALYEVLGSRGFQQSDYAIALKLWSDGAFEEV